MNIFDMTVGQVLYKGSSFVAEQAFALSRYLSPKAGTIQAKANEAATQALTGQPPSELFSASELAGPVALTLGFGWGAAASAHKALKSGKMLLTGEKIEVVKESTQAKEGVTLKDRLFVPHTRTGLAISAVAYGLLAPALVYAGNQAGQVISDKLAEVAGLVVPYNFLTLTGAALYAAYLTNSYLKA